MRSPINLSRLTAFAPVVALVAGLTACSKDDVNRIGSEPDKPKVALINFTGSTLNAKNYGLVVKVDGKRKYDSPTISGASTGYFALESGNRTISLDSSVARTAAATPEGQVFAQTSELKANQFYSLFATGPIAKPDIVWTTDDLTRPAAGKVRVRFVHLSPDAPGMTLLAGLSSTTVLSPLSSAISYKGVSEFKEIDAGSYTLQVQNALGAVVPTFSVTASDAIVDPVIGSASASAGSFKVNFKDGKVYTLMLRGYVDPVAAGQSGKILAISSVINVYW